MNSTRRRKKDDERMKKRSFTYINRVATATAETLTPSVCFFCSF